MGHLLWEATASYWPALLCAAIFAITPRLNRVIAWLTTLVHEVGHAIISLGGISQIRVEHDASGVTQTRQGVGLLFLPLRIANLLIGYAFPIYLGVALLLLVAVENIAATSILLGAVAVILLLGVRNLFGVLLLVGYATMYLIAFIAYPQDVGLPVAAFLGFALLIRGAWDIISSGWALFRGLLPGSDFHLLRAQFPLPARVWYIIFLAVHTCVLIVAASLLA